MLKIKQMENKSRESKIKTESLKNKTSYLEIILGCMYSGKTSKIVEIYKQCQFCFI